MNFAYGCFFFRFVFLTLTNIKIASWYCQEDRDSFFLMIQGFLLKNQYLRLREELYTAEQKGGGAGGQALRSVLRAKIKVTAQITSLPQATQQKPF